MIDYDPGSVLFICGIQGSVFPKGLMWAAPASAFAVVLHFIGPFEDATFTLDGADTIWAGYTFVLGFLVVFRNSQAYSRFWEGATLIQQTRGEWFNAVSSLFAFCTNAEDKRSEVDEFQHLIVHLMSVLFCQALQQICDLEDDSLEIIDIPCCSEEQLRFLAGTSDRCEVVLQWLQRAIVDATNNNVVTVAPPILSRAYQELSRGIVNLNNVRKIKDVPFPYPYAQMIAVMLIIHWMMTPVIAAYYIKSAVWAAVLSFLVTGAFWSLIYIAQEIDHPFGEDANDFNIAEIMQAMNTSLVTLLQPMAQKPPKVESWRSKSDIQTKLMLKSSDALILGTAEVDRRRDRLSRAATGGAVGRKSERVRRLSHVVEGVMLPEPMPFERATSPGIVGMAQKNIEKIKNICSHSCSHSSFNTSSGVSGVLTTCNTSDLDQEVGTPRPPVALEPIFNTSAVGREPSVEPPPAAPPEAEARCEASMRRPFDPQLLVPRQFRGSTEDPASRRRPPRRHSTEGSLSQGHWVSFGQEDRRSWVIGNSLEEDPGPVAPQHPNDYRDHTDMLEVAEVRLDTGQAREDASPSSSIHDVSKLTAAKKPKPTARGILSMFGHDP